MKISSLVSVGIVALALTGCRTPSIENKVDPKTQRATCRLKDLEIKGDRSISIPYLNIRREDDHSLQAWMTFYLLDGALGPKKEPELIIKAYQKKLLVQKWRLKGVGRHFLEVVEFSAREQGKLASTPPSVDSPVSAKEMWPQAFAKDGTPSLAFDTLNYNMGQKGVSFTLSLKQFEQLLSADKVEILIQTQERPIVVQWGPEEMKYLAGFQKTCLIPIIQ